MTYKQISAAYEAFGRWAASEISHPWMNDLDGCAAQEKLAELGLISCEPYCAEKHAHLDDVGLGDDVYTFVNGCEPRGT